MLVIAWKATLRGNKSFRVLTASYTIILTTVALPFSLLKRATLSRRVVCSPIF